MLSTVKYTQLALPKKRRTTIGSAERDPHDPNVTSRKKGTWKKIVNDFT
jgi:hypothetical protein